MKSLFVKISLLTLFMTGLLHADSNPVVSRVYGNQYTPQVADTQNAGIIGALDATFDGDGSVDLGGTSSSVAAVQTLSDGTFVVLFDNISSDATLVKYNAEAVVVWTCTLTNLQIEPVGSVQYSSIIAPSIFVDAQGRFIVCGQNNTASSNVPWICRVAASGTIDGTFNFTDGANWPNWIWSIAQQSSGKIIVAGWGSSYAQIGRYNQDGSLDTSFGSSGYVVLDGTAPLPSVGTAGISISNIVIDSSSANLDDIYISFKPNATANGFTANNAYIAQFSLEGVLGSHVALPALNSSDNLVLAQLYDSLNSGNFVIGGEVFSGTTDVYVTCAAYNLGSLISGSYPFDAQSITGHTADNFSIRDLITTSDGNFYIIGSDGTTQQMAVIRLVGSSGILDATFNTYNASSNPSGVVGGGYNFFNITPGSGTLSQSVLNSAAIAPDGQIYAAGYQQTTSPTATIPYVSRLNNNQYVSQVQQYPNSQEQGNQDYKFGTAATETYSGVTTPINGIYGALLQQKAQSVVELSTGNMIVGIDGYVGGSAYSTMLLAQLTPLGALETLQPDGWPASGYVTITNSSSADQFLHAIAVDTDDNLYIAGGTAGTGATLSKYDNSGTQQWAILDAVAGAQGVGVVLQGATRALLFENIDDVHGRISGYDLSTGALDTTFGPYVSGSSGPQTGRILTGSYSLNMGPVYSGVVSQGGIIYVAYKNTSGGGVSVAAIKPNGTGLFTVFAPTQTTPGIYADVFGETTIASNNIRIGFDRFDQLVVAATLDSALYITRINPGTGTFDPTFNHGSVLSLSINLEGIPATSLQLTRLTGVSDGTTLVTMWDDGTDDTMILARIAADGSGFDTTFNSQGSEPGVLPLQIGEEVTDYFARTATCAMVQSATGAGVNQGNIVLAAFEQVTSSDATPMVMRVYGALGTTEIKDYPAELVVPGTFAAGYDISTLDSLGTGAGKVVFVYPNSSPYFGTMLVGIDTGSNSTVSRLHIDTMSLDTTFNSTGTATISGLAGISCINIDSNNKVLVGGGTSGGTGWAQRLTANGAADVSFMMPSSVGAISSVNGIAQQKSGRYILAAQNTVATTDYPVLVAFQDALVSPATTLAVDPTFNPMLVGGTGSSQFGIFGLGTTISAPVTGLGLYTVSINSDDTIIAAYATGAAGSVYLAQVTADGSGYVNAFNGGSPVNTSIQVDSSASVRAAIDSTGKYVVGASYNPDGGQVSVLRYTTAGAPDTTFNGGIVQTVYNLGYAGITLTSLMETIDQQTIFTGYNTDDSSVNGPIFAVRLNASGYADSTWNPSPLLPDDTGVLTFGSGTTPPAVEALSAYIQNDGTVALIGSSQHDSSGDVIVMQVYGDEFVYEVVQSQLQQGAGVLDLTLPGGASGSMRLNGSVYVEGTTVSATITGVPQKIAIYNTTTNGSLINANGSMMIGSSDGTNSYVTMVNPDLSANTNYGSTGVVTLTGKDNLVDMYVTGNIASSTALPVLVTGNDAGAMWAGKITATGIEGAIYVGTNNLTAAYAIRQATNNRILVAGQTSSSGAIAAFGSVASGGTYPLDNTFGNQGVSQTYPTGSATTLTDGGAYYLTGVNNPIADMAVDSLDRMYIAYLSGSNVIVERILADGTGVDSSFNATFLSPIYGFSSTQIRIALDETNSRVVVAAQDGSADNNIIRVKRFKTSDGAAAGFSTVINDVSSVANLSDLFIDALQHIYVLGYFDSGTRAGDSVVVRLRSINSTNITKDTSYASGGVADVVAGSITSVKAGALDPDRRVYFVGTDGSNSYIARLYGDAYTSEVCEAIAVGTAGTIDPSFGSSNPTAGYYDLSILSGILTSSTGKAIIPLANGGNYIAVDNGTNSQLFRTIGSGALDPNYGGGDGIAVLANPGVNSMMIDGSGRVVLVGTTPGNHGWVQRYANGNSGNFDSGFGSSGLIDLGATTTATAAVEQTLARLVVAGTKSGGNGALFAYTSIDPYTTTTGAVDTTFNFNGATPGVFDTGVANTVNSLVADSYDRLIFAQLNGAGNAVLLYRLTPTGELDATFGTAGVVTLDSVSFGAAPDAASQIYVALNSAGYIVVAAHVTGGNIGVLVCDNGTASSGNGAITNTVYAISGLTGASLTGLATSADGYIYAMGNQSGTNPMWIARLTASGSSAVALNTAGFNPTSGIFTYAAGSGSTVHDYYGFAVRPDGRIEAVGQEKIADTTYTPWMIRVYNDPYTTQTAQTPDSKAVGTNDLTLGLTGANGVTFFGVPSGDAAMSQSAQAIALQDDNNFVVAVHGLAADIDTKTQIMIDKFDTDGLLNLSFNTTGQATITTPYFAVGANQYAQDMVTFTTLGGVHKAIVAGYVTMATPSLTGSLLMQYDLDAAALDTANFGGFDGDTAGIAFGDCKKINSVGIQSMGRIIAAGLDQNNNGVLLGYTAQGKLDPSFAGGGYQSTDTGTTGIYSHAIDSLNRIAIVYNSGSGTVKLARFLPDGTHDTSYAATTSAISTGVANTDMKVAVDGSNNVYASSAALSSGFLNNIAVAVYDQADGSYINSNYIDWSTIGGSINSVYVLSSLFIDQSGHVIVSAYDSHAQTVVVLRLQSYSSLILDTTFHGTGYLVYQPAGGTVSQIATDAMIHPDGRILVVGSEN